jgi:hypothetical protein
VVLFGDSHMQQWQPAFIAAGISAHWRVVNWTKSSCPPALMTVRNPQLGGVYTQCNTWRTRTLQRIAALHPTVVVLTGLESEAPADWPAATVAADTAATARELQQTTTAKIVYFEDTPYPGFDVPACVAAHLGNVEACSFSLSRAYTSPARHEAINEALRRLPGVTLINPAAWICPDGRCPAVVGNLLTYRDQSHLSVEFSKWLGPIVAYVLNQLQPRHAA